MVAFDFGEVCVPIARALAEHDDVLLALPRRELEPVEGDIGPAVAVRAFHKPRLRQPLHQLRMCRRVLGAVRAFGPDLVHLQQGHLWFNLALPLLRPLPLVVTIHDHRPHPGDRGGRKTPVAAMQIAFRRADQAIVHAHRLKEEVVALRGLQAERVHVVPHVAVGAAHAAPAVEEDERMVLFFGRIWPYKGLEHLIRAQPHVTEAVPDAHFVIAGRGEPLERYRAMMRDPSRFTVLDEYVSPERRAELFSRAALVVLPYVEASQSGVVPVAYTFARPVVATAVGGLPEAVEDGRTGLVVAPGDPGALADAIVRLLRDPGLRRSLGAAGRRKLEREWSPERIAEQTREVHGRALAAVPRRERAARVDPARVRRAVLALHHWLTVTHWRGDGLVGPDCGIRFNYRAGRFVKSALPALPWRDELYYLQGQAYWILANQALLELTGDARCADLAGACARGILARQEEDGGWVYPNREWRGRVATAEGSWAAIALLAVHRRTGDAASLAGALRWHAYLETRIGYRRAPGGLAANYFAGRPGDPVPNTTAFVLRLLAELADVTSDGRFLAVAPELLGFLGVAQARDGELPYEVGADGRRPRLEHFQCVQYNAFQCLDLLRYSELTGDPAVLPLLEGLLAFLRRSVRPDGSVPYACERPDPQVSYHAAAVAAALHAGASVGGPGCGEASARALDHLLALQRPDGSFPHSRRDYGVLRDERSYPRHLAMLLTHLLAVVEVRAPAVTA